MYESTLSLLRALASLKLTLVAMMALLAGVLVAYFSQDRSSFWFLAPLLLLSLNLLAAIVFNPRIRQNTGLLMFHLCLLMIAVLTVLSELTSMKGRVEVVQGTAFDAGNVTVVEQGPWYAFSGLQQVAFVQGDIEVDYVAGLRRGPTRSQLLLDDGSVIVGDNVAFTSHGYRFYTTSNKGFAAVFNWYAKDGRVLRGTINFPSYPLYDWKQQNQWRTPGGAQLAMTLVVNTSLDRNRQWSLQGVDNARLQIDTTAGVKYTLVPGGTVAFDDGVLEFDAVRMWMGYTIFYNPLLVWFFAAALVGVAGLAWHYYLKLSSPAPSKAVAGHQAGRGHAVTTTQP